MKIRTLEIKNFRSLKDIEIHLTDCTALIGRNNNGKSNIMRAIRLLLEGGRSDVKETDFWNKEAPVEICATLEGVTKFLPLSADKHREKIQAFIDGDRLRIKKFYGSPEKDSGKIYLVNPESGEPQLPTGIDAGLKQILPEPIVVESLADATEEAGMKSSTAVGKIFAKVLDAIGEQARPALDNAFVFANSLLNVVDGKDTRVHEIQDIEASITGYIQQNFRDCRAVVKVAMPTLEDILGGVSIDLDDGRRTPFFSKGQGLQRVLYLSLLRTLADKVRGGERLSRPFILLVEEAEVFLHPTAQCQMLTALKTISVAQQVVFSTHSPAMVSPETLSDVILVRKDPNTKETIIPPSKEIPPEDQRFLLEVANLERGARFFFADRVMLVEGRSDACLADAIARRLAIEGYEPERHVFVEMGGKARLPDFQRYLRSKGQQVWVLADLDFLWDGAGAVLNADADLSVLCEEVERLVVEAEPSFAHPQTNQVKRQKKAAKFLQLRTNPGLAKLKEAVVSKLRLKQIFVLSDGEIEDYVGLTESSKGRYLQAALEIMNGARPINSEDELRAVFNSFING